MTSKYTFSSDWFSSNIPIWEQVLTPFKGQPVQFFEIGSYEGRSATWMLDNILTHPDAKLYCCDPFPGRVEGDTVSIYDRFVSNISEHKDKVVICRGFAEDVLKSTLVNDQKFHMIYVDGDHYSHAALEDAVLCFNLLHDGGLIIFDDYLWDKGYDKTHTPKPGIDAFISGYSELVDVIYKGYQVIVRKKLPSELNLSHYVRYINMMIQRDPNNIDYRLELVLIFYKLGHYDDALKQCNAIIMKNPTCIKAYRNKAILLKDIGQLEEAIKTLLHGITLYPNDDQDLVEANATLVQLQAKS